MAETERDVDMEIERPGQWGLVAAAWLAVGLPLAWGIFTTLKKAALLFK
jgi:hypothetical protein